MKPTIEYRPKRTAQRSASPKPVAAKAASKVETEPSDSRERPAPISVSENASAQALAALEAYKAAERAKVLARVKKHREKIKRK